MKTFPERPRPVSIIAGNQANRLRPRAAVEVPNGLLLCDVPVACELSPAAAATSPASPTRLTFGVEPASARARHHARIPARDVAGRPQAAKA